MASKIRRCLPPLGLLAAALMILIATLLRSDGLMGYTRSISDTHRLDDGGVDLAPYYLPITEPAASPAVPTN